MFTCSVNFTNTGAIALCFCFNIHCMPHDAVISATLIGEKTCIFYLHIKAEGLEGCFDTFITHCSSKSDNNVKIIFKFSGIQ